MLKYYYPAHIKQNSEAILINMKVYTFQSTVAVLKIRSSSARLEETES